MEQKKTSLIHQACQDGNIELVKSLIYPGWEHEIDSISGRTPLHYACESDCYELVQTIIIGGSNNNNNNNKSLLLLYKLDIEKNIPMHIACRYSNNEKIIKLLLSTSGGDSKMVISKNIYGRLPLHEACYNGNFNIVRIIYETNKFAIQICDNYGKFPIHYACESGNTNVVKLLLSNYNKASFLQLRDKEKMYPIHYACFNGKKDLIHYLWEQYPIAFEQTDINGRTPLNIAEENENNNIIKLIQRKLNGETDVDNDDNINDNDDDDNDSGDEDNYDDDDDEKENEKVSLLMSRTDDSQSSSSNISNDNSSSSNNNSNNGLIIRSVTSSPRTMLEIDIENGNNNNNNNIQEDLTTFNTDDNNNKPISNTSPRIQLYLVKTKLSSYMHIIMSNRRAFSSTKTIFLYPIILLCILYIVKQAIIIIL